MAIKEDGGYYSPTVADGVVYQAYSKGKGGALMAVQMTATCMPWIAQQVRRNGTTRSVHGLPLHRPYQATH